ncbi:LysR family transcriptional regulator [Rheinheimera mangrovi]|uniref:LysR family transcriptional regulator n=1 Tax=Rheinheimera mangrovi TaxID=2498451 RepID=UPI000F8F62B6|nr:LysR family transcriptional regulator [Rheinheimera mangrovi]
MQLSDIDLNAVPVFLVLAQERSFTAAAERLGCAKTKVSLQIKALESRLGVALFRRTTRLVSLTQAGEQLYQHCLPLLQQLNQQLMEAQSSEHNLSGTLVISAPEDYAHQVLVPALLAFRQHHPALTFELKSSDQIKDLVKEGIDLSIRAGWLKDSSQKAISLGSFEQWLVASPAYLQRHGMPAHPAELPQHHFICFSLLPSALHWTFNTKSEEVQVQMRSQIKAGSTGSVTALLKAGAGLGVITDYSAKRLIKQGELRQVLPQWQLPKGGIYAVYPPGHFRPARVRLFVEFLREWLLNNNY